jgi:hypothetical protein
MRDAGWKASPSMGQRSPTLDCPVTAAMGKATRAFRRQGRAAAGAARGRRCHARRSRCTCVGPRDQRVKHRKLVVEPCAGEAHGKHERAPPGAGAPCRNPCCPVRRSRGRSRSPSRARVGARDRIEITDHGLRAQARGQAASAPPSTATSVGAMASAASDPRPQAPRPHQRHGVWPDTTGFQVAFSGRPRRQSPLNGPIPVAFFWNQLERATAK